MFLAGKFSIFSQCNKVGYVLNCLIYSAEQLIKPNSIKRLYRGVVAGYGISSQICSRQFGISSQIVCNILNVCYFQNVDETAVSYSEVCSDTRTTDTLDSLEETNVSDDDDDVDWEINLEDDVDSSESDDENNTAPKNLVRRIPNYTLWLACLKLKIRSSPFCACAVVWVPTCKHCSYFAVFYIFST